MPHDDLQPSVRHLGRPQAGALLEAAHLEDVRGRRGPKRFNLNKLTKKFNTWSFNACIGKFWRAQGGSFAARAQSAYTWWSFIPTKAERNNGGRWLRCDLSLLGAHPGGNSFLPPLPNLAFPVIGSRPITDSTRKCLANTGNLYVTPCSYPHAARADQTFVINSKAFPTVKTMAAAAKAQCPGKRFSSPFPTEWAKGDHTMTCYSVTTS